MNQKKSKERRRYARQEYDVELFYWQQRKPKRWRIFSYMKWKKQKPILPSILSCDRKKVNEQ